MTRPSQQELIAEAAELARRFAWPLDAALDLEHRDRRLLLAVGSGASGSSSRAPSASASASASPDDLLR
jgi:hypothetical protein